MLTMTTEGLFRFGTLSFCSLPHRALCVAVWFAAFVPAASAQEMELIAPPTDELLVEEGRVSLRAWHATALVQYQRVLDLGRSPQAGFVREALSGNRSHEEGLRWVEGLWQAAGVVEASLSLPSPPRVLTARQRAYLAQIEPIIQEALLAFRYWLRRAGENFRSPSAGLRRAMGVDQADYVFGMAQAAIILNVALNDFEPLRDGRSRDQHSCGEAAAFEDLENKTVSISFDPDSTSVTLQDTLSGFSQHDYLVHASAGQHMMLALVSAATPTMFVLNNGLYGSDEPQRVEPSLYKEVLLQHNGAAEHGGWAWAGLIPSTGSYIIRILHPDSIASSEARSPYTLSVQIE